MSSAPFRLLLVEDELADALLFQDMLSEQDQDITVHHVQNGQEALAYLCEPGHPPRPHLIVLDLNMPVMNGHEFLTRIKALPAVRSIPVLVLSTSEHPGDIQRAYEGQVSGYVVKPGSYPEYMHVLETIRAYWRGLVRLPSLEEVVQGRAGF
ncbi:response regulator [Deinococcus arenicola]|uniref:Response regulator n=1 Tax=Deinococcus arenicola TaxID=2994950 RepID=A0ABU4DQX9_9DEIO|nr:response regulator [Deinococcus sp. ZS9-10]MDV6374104.1 response regulator [Deinococcus sp. ZS9-10]